MDPVMVNFICQLHWAMGFPGTWPNVIVGMSVKVFPDEMNV